MHLDQQGYRYSHEHKVHGTVNRTEGNDGIVVFVRPANRRMFQGPTCCKTCTGHWRPTRGDEDTEGCDDVTDKGDQEDVVKDHPLPRGHTSKTAVEQDYRDLDDSEDDIVDDFRDIEILEKC